MLLPPRPLLLQGEGASLSSPAMTVFCLGQQDAMARFAAGRPYRCRKDSSAQHETCCTRIVRPHNAFRSLVRIRDSPRGCLKEISVHSEPVEGLGAVDILDPPVTLIDL